MNRLFDIIFRVHIYTTVPQIRIRVYLSILFCFVFSFMSCVYCLPSSEFIRLIHGIVCSVYFWIFFPIRIGFFSVRFFTYFVLLLTLYVILLSMALDFLFGDGFGTIHDTVLLLILCTFECLPFLTLFIFGHYWTFHQHMKSFPCQSLFIHIYVEYISMCACWASCDSI